MEVRAKHIVGLEGLEVVGEVDHSSVHELRTPLLELVHGGVRRIILDLTHVTYIDSAGIAVLYTAVEELPEGGWIGLLNVGPNTERILTLAGLPSQPSVRVFHDRRSAEEAASQAGPGEG